MSAKSVFFNKYSFSVLILLALIALDVFLHKGITRVILPSGFTEARQPFLISPCKEKLAPGNKNWFKAINTPALLNELPKETAGIEIDVYFDTSANSFFVYHDSSRMSRITLDSILEEKQKFLPAASVWLDYKNLNAINAQPSLARVSQLCKTYALDKKMIIESSNAETLHHFCEAGFFTSFYVPFHNPYKATEKQVVKFIDSVAATIKKNPPSALSGYYFQYPLLKKFFPNYPLLIWADNSSLSAVGYLFKMQVTKDSAVRVLLTPND